MKIVHLKNSMAFLLLLLSCVVHGQSTISGVVLAPQDRDTLPLYLANVWWADGSDGVQTNQNGEFEIKYNSEDNRLIIQYIGYQRDTVRASQRQTLRIVLKPQSELRTFVKAARIDAQKIDLNSLGLTRDLNEKTLRKAPCCNLSESFENTPSVDISFTDALTGAKRIEMLGLAGKYALITRELIPVFRGFSGTHGLAFIPGQWLSGIQVTKGAGPVTNGPESISGHINVELKKPESMDPLFVNAYVNQGLRTEINLIKAFELNNKVSTALFAHGNVRPVAWDMNSDGFSDMPVGRQFNFLNRWKYDNGNGFEGMAVVQFVDDEKRAGDMEFASDGIWPENNINFPLDQDQQALDAYIKAGYVFGTKTFQSIGLQAQLTHFENESRFRLKSWNAIQDRLYVNLIYQLSDIEERHTLRAGPNFWIERSNEKIENLTFTFESRNLAWVRIPMLEREETVIGGFSEYTYQSKENRFSFAAGLHGGYNQLFERWFAAPRTHLKWEFMPKTVLRASAGRGIQTPAVFADFSGALSSNRVWRFRGDDLSLPYGMDQEIANNYGISLQRAFNWLYREGNFNVDYFFTDFVQKVVADWYTDAREIGIYMLDGRSRAHAFQAEWNWEAARRLELHAAYRYHEVRTDYNNGYLLKPLMPLHRSFLNVAYSTRNDWMFDFTIQYFSRSRYPTTAQSPEAFRLPVWTDPFALSHLQITKSWENNIELYFGAENLLNYRIPRAIIGENGANPYFDASMIWGPIFGRMAFAGFRWSVSKKEE